MQLLNLIFVAQGEQSHGGRSLKGSSVRLSTSWRRDLFKIVCACTGQSFLKCILGLEEGYVISVGSRHWSA